MIGDRKNPQTGAARRKSTYHLSRLTYHFLAAAALAGALGGCGTAAKRDSTVKAPPAPGGGGYYLDDGPGANPPVNLDSIPDAVPRPEPLNRGTSRPYVVMGRSYTPMTSLQPYRARGIATWYGRRYHGKPTSSGELYDMYAMTAAHATLPIPSYARVTNLANGKSVVVRINDRGPFVDGRIIDLSYTAAHRIGVLAGGSAMVEVESLLPGGAGTPTVVEAPPALPSPPPEPAPVPVARTLEPPLTPPPPVPDASTPLPVTASAPAATPESGGYFLQLGAFGSRENAEGFLARMKTQVDWLATTLHIFARDGLFRVRAGPYASQPEARQAADRISQALGIKPFVLMQ